MMHLGEAKLGSSLELESCGNWFCNDMFFVLKNLEGLNQAGSFFVRFGKNSISSKAKKLDFYQKLDSKSQKTRY